MRLLRTTLLLTQEQRDALDDLATRIRQRTRIRPGASSIIRASIDSTVERFRRDGLRGLDDLEELKRGATSREAEPAIERWLRQQLTGRKS